MENKVNDSIKVAIVNPSYPDELRSISSRPNYTLGLLGASIKDPDFQNLFCKAYDLNVDFNNVEIQLFDEESYDGSSQLKKIQKFKPDIVALTTVTATIKRAIEISNKLKNDNHNLMIVVGGHGIKAFPKVIKNTCIDYGVPENGQEALPLLVSQIKGYIQNHKFRNDNIILEKVTNNNCLILINERKINFSKWPSVKSFYLYGGLKFSNYAPILDSEHYYFTDLFSNEQKKNVFGSLMHAVFFYDSCPYKCKFCVETGKTQRREIESVINDIEFLLDNNVRFIFIADGTPNQNPKVFKALLKRIILEKFADRGLVLRLNLRADRNVDDETIELLKRAGVGTVLLGVETGTDTLRKKIAGKSKGNRLKNELIINVTNKLKEAKIGVRHNFMFNLPGQNFDDYAAIFQMILSARPTGVSVSNYAAFPGSNLFQDILEITEKITKKRLTEDDIIEMIHQGQLGWQRPLNPKRQSYKMIHLSPNQLITNKNIDINTTENIRELVGLANAILRGDKSKRERAINIYRRLPIYAQKKITIFNKFLE